MMRRVAAVLGAVGAIGGVVSAAVLGVGLVDADRVIAAASAPLPRTVVIAEPEGAGQAPQPSWPSNLPAELIAGLPEYTAVHDRDTYTRVQVWIRLCMRDQQGHNYAFELADADEVVGLVSQTFVPMAEGFDQHEQQSLYGEPGNLLPDYDWMAGGCYGQALQKANLIPGAPGSFTADELAQIDELVDVLVGPYTLEEHLSGQ